MSDSNIVWHNRSFNDATAAAPSTQAMIDVPLTAAAEGAVTQSLVVTTAAKKKKKKPGCCKTCCSPIRGLACCVLCTVCLEFTIPMLFAWLCLDATTGGGSALIEEEEEETETKGKLKPSKKKQPYANTKQAIAALKALASQYQRDLDNIVDKDTEAVTPGEFERIWGGKMQDFSRIIQIPNEHKLKAAIGLSESGGEGGEQAETEGLMDLHRDVLANSLIQKHLNAQDTASMAGVSHAGRAAVHASRKWEYLDENKGRAIFKQIDWAPQDDWSSRKDTPAMNPKQSMQFRRVQALEMRQYWNCPAGLRLLGSGAITPEDIAEMIAVDFPSAVHENITDIDERGSNILERTLKAKTQGRGKKGAGMLLFMFYKYFAEGRRRRERTGQAFLAKFVRSATNNPPRITFDLYRSLYPDEWILFFNIDVTGTIRDGMMTEQEAWLLFQGRDSSVTDEKEFRWTSKLAVKPDGDQSDEDFEDEWNDYTSMGSFACALLPAYPVKDRSILWSFYALYCSWMRPESEATRAAGIREFKRVFPQPITEETVAVMSKLDVFRDIPAICAVARAYMQDRQLEGRIDFVRWMTVHKDSREARELYTELNAEGALDNKTELPLRPYATRPVRRSKLLEKIWQDQMLDEEAYYTDEIEEEEEEAGMEGLMDLHRDVLANSLIQKHLNTQDTASMARVSRNGYAAVAEAKNRAYDDEKRGRQLVKTINWTLPDSWWRSNPGYTGPESERKRLDKLAQIVDIKKWAENGKNVLRLLGAGTITPANIEAMIRYDTPEVADDEEEDELPTKLVLAIKGRGEKHGIDIKLFYLFTELDRTGVFCRPSDSGKLPKLRMERYTNMSIGDFALFTRHLILWMLHDGEITEDELWLLYEARDASIQDEAAFAWTDSIEARQQQTFAAYPPKVDRSILWCMAAAKMRNYREGLPLFKRVFPQRITRETIKALSKLDVFQQLAAICLVAGTYMNEHNGQKIDFVTWMQNYNGRADVQEIREYLNEDGALDNHTELPPRPHAARPARQSELMKRHLADLDYEYTTTTDEEDEEEDNEPMAHLSGKPKPLTREQVIVVYRRRRETIAALNGLAKKLQEEMENEVDEGAATEVEEENIPNYAKNLPSENSVREMLGLSDKMVLRSATTK